MKVVIGTGRVTNKLKYMINSQILKNEIRPFYNKFIELTKEWAINDFNTLRSWVDDYGKGKFGFGFATEKYSLLPKYIIESNGDVQEHINKIVGYETNRYDYNIDKIIDDINSFGLDESSNINVNINGTDIEITITDGKKSLEYSSTIVNNKIQRPYYIINKK